MNFYKTKANKIKGTSYKEVHRQTRKIYDEIAKKTKRKAYIRSAYFKKEKVFLDLFWSHLFEKKHLSDLLRRLKFYPCALELIQFSKHSPSVKINPNKSSEILYRFAGITSGKEAFFVQIKRNKRGNRKWLMSIFPEK